MQSSDIMPALVPLWAVMTGVTILMSFLMMRRDLKKHPNRKKLNAYAAKSGETVQNCSRKQKKLITALILLAFAADIAAMILLDINGDDATNLIAGTALVLTCVICLIVFRGNTCAEKLGDFLVDGFSFTVKGFAPAVIMIGFFSLGSSEFAPMILGENAPACLSETVGFLVSHVKIPGAALAFLQSAVGIIYSLDGSGFAGLTVIGSIANSYPVTTEAVKILTALGQIVIIWVGGTIIPWSVIPVSSVCGVKPVELAKKNLVPVLTGIAAATATAACMIACAKWRGPAVRIFTADCIDSAQNGIPKGHCPFGEVWSGAPLQIIAQRYISRFSSSVSGRRARLRKAISPRIPILRFRI